MGSISVAANDEFKATLRYIFERVYRVAVHACSWALVPLPNDIVGKEILYIVFLSFFT